MESKMYILPGRTGESNIAGDNVLALLASIVNSIKALQQSYDDISRLGQSELLTNADSWTLLGVSVPVLRDVVHTTLTYAIER